MSDVFDNEVERFLEEVDAFCLAPTTSLNNEDVPQTDWVVHVDPTTNLPFYYNSNSKTSTWQIPKEYCDYLQKYEAYITEVNSTKNKSPNKKNIQPVETKTSTSSEKPTSSTVYTMPHVNARKRRRIKRAWLRDETNPLSVDSGNVEFLSEYIAYSNSSVSESDESNSPISLENTGVGHNGIANKDPIQDNVNIESSSNPNPPSPTISPNKTHNEFEIIGPQLPSNMCVAFPTTSKTNEDLNNAETYRLEHLQNLSQTLLEKFAVLDVQTDSISTLLILYIQLSTRLEDYNAGSLSLDRFEEKLEELNSYLIDYEQYYLPHGWRCEWNSENKQYVYTCESTGVTQFHFPNEYYGEDDGGEHYSEEMPSSLANNYEETSEPNQNTETSDVVNELKQIYEPVASADAEEVDETDETGLEKCIEFEKPNWDGCEIVHNYQDQEDSSESLNDSDKNSENTTMSNSNELTKRIVRKNTLSSRVISTNKELPGLVNRWQKLQENL